MVARLGDAAWARQIRATYWIERLLVAGLVVLATVLRLHRFDRIPYFNETADESAYLWSGWSFLHDGVPTAWSSKLAYGDAPVYLWNGFRYRLVAPWFDHPPLYGLLIGWVASLAGATEMLEASVSVARLVSVALGVLSVALLYLLARRNYGRPVAFASALLFATIPTIVVSSRLAVAESFIVVLLLGSILAIQTYLDRRVGGWFWLVAAGRLAGAAGLAKVPGFAVGISVILLLLGAKRWLAAVIAGGLVALVGLAPYVLYGMFVNRTLFAQVVLSQTERATGLDVFPNLLMNQVATPVAWRDAWFPFLWIALVYVAARRDQLIPIGIGPYLIFLVAAVSHDDLRAPYREPLFPFLCLAGGIFLCDVIAHPDLIRGALVVFGVAFGKLTEGFDGWSMLGTLPDGYQLYPFLVATLALPLVAVLVWPNRVSRYAGSALIAAALVVAFAGNLQTIAREDDQYPIPHPLIALPLLSPTYSGLTLASYRAEPDTIPPGGSLRLWTDWVAQGDVSHLPLTAVLRHFDRRTNQYGSYTTLGESAFWDGTAGSELTVLLGGTLDDGLEEGDYDLGVRVAGQTVDIGIVRVRSSTSEARDTETVALPTTFSDGIALDEALLAPIRSSSAGLVQSVALRLRATEPLGATAKVFAHLEDGEGHLVAQSDGRPGGITKALAVGVPVDDWRDLIIPPGTPAGQYYLSVGLYEPISGRRSTNQGGSDHVALGLVSVGPPLTDGDVPHHLGTRLSGGIDLVGYNVVESAVPSSDKLTLYWRSRSPLAHDYTVFVHVVDSAGVIRAQADGPPDSGRVPTSTWRASQIVPDDHSLNMSDLPSGSYQVLVGLYLAPNGPPLPVTGSQSGAAFVTAIQVP